MKARHMAVAALSACIAALAITGCVSGKDSKGGASTLVGEGATTNYYIVSDIKLKKMWTRQPVMATEDDGLIDASGTLVTFAEAEAQKVAIEHLDEISNAASAAMTNAIDYLLAYTNQIPPSAQHISMYFRPDTLRPNLASYVVHETTDGVTDTQYVWYNTSLSLAPIRFVEYETSTGKTIVKCKWWDWKADGETLTVNGNTWHGVHRCTITRPIECRYEMCRSTKNDKWGSDNGFAFGSMVCFLNGRPTFTGMVSNVEDNVVLQFKQGAFVGQQPITNVVTDVTE